MSDSKYVRLPTDIYSSISRFINSSDYFPTHDRRIGISVRSGYHPEYKQVMIEISEERPSFVSTNRGEYIEIDEETDDKIREKLIELSDYCLKVSDELREHSERLREEAKRETVIDKEKIRELENRESATDTYSTEEESRAHTRTHTHAPANSRFHARRSSSSSTPNSSPKPALNLALLAD